MKMLREFFKYEASGGILLGLAALFALLMKNSSLGAAYDTILTVPAAVQIGTFAIDKPILLWINDGLMAIFFLLVGLEIKREVSIGHLASKSQIMLPAIAALGGLITPAMIYLYFNWGNETAMHGWAIPAATDIAFALGILSLLGKRVPESLKIALMAIAILDDLAAIVIIALFYTSELSVPSLIAALIAVFVLISLNRRGVTKLTPYLLTGLLLWVCVLKSGVHATLAGVLLAFFIPLKGQHAEASPSVSLEHTLHPYVAYMILPVFAFANAGVSLQGLSLSILMHPITLGIAAGLFFGKQLGVMFFSFIGVCLNWFKLPAHVTWSQYYGLALITGVGFTMSLFIGTLAFHDVDSQNAVRLGVLLGSLLSGVLGYVCLAVCCRKSG